jgi:hypothetical protein
MQADEEGGKNHNAVKPEKTKTQSKKLENHYGRTDHALTN